MVVDKDTPLDCRFRLWWRLLVGMIGPVYIGPQELPLRLAHMMDRIRKRDGLPRPPLPLAGSLGRWEEVIWLRTP